MSEVIVTHINPDLDAVASIWLIRRFFLGWEEAKTVFVPVGQTFRGAPPDDDPEVIHVDTGLGKFDHHQTADFTCSAERVFKEISKERKLTSENLLVLKRMIVVIKEEDNGRAINWGKGNDDLYEFMLPGFLPYLGGGSEDRDEKKVEFASSVLEMIFSAIKRKIQAEEKLKEGQPFKTSWGKAIAVISGNDQVLEVGQKKGYVLVARQNPADGQLRIYSRWDKGVDLSGAFEQFKKLDPAASWYLHPNKCLLLNGSRSDPTMVPTKLSLKEVIKILQKA